MYFRLSTLLMTLSFGCLTIAQVPFPNHCPDVTIMDSFDLDAYMGIWYEYTKYPFVFEIGKKCMYARYENIGNDTVSVMNAAINRFTNTRSNVTGKAIVKAPAQLLVSFSKRSMNTRKPANYLVLSTDYQTYSVVYSCTNVTAIAHIKFIWILTRERKPTAETVATAKKILIDNDLSLTFLIDTLQDGCPEPDDNSIDMELLNETNRNPDNGIDELSLDGVERSTDSLPNMIDKA